MNFDITQETDSEAGDKTKVIDFLSDELKDYFAKRDYGQGVQNFYIGCITVRPRVGYEAWYKIRKPRYKALSKVKMPDNSIQESKGVFAYDIKPDYDVFVSNSDMENKKLMATEIMKSLSNLDALPKKVKDFDKERFKADMEQFFRAEKLI